MSKSKKKINRIIWLVVILFLIIGGVFVYQKNNKEIVTPAPQVVENEPQEVIIPEQKELGVKISPKKIVQGEPVLITVEGVPATTTVKSIVFNGRKLPVFDYKSEPTALLGLDLRQYAGSFPLSVTLSSGQVLNESIKVTAREVIKEDFGIPDKLGGNTTEAEQELINTLVQEAAIINAIPSGNTKLWTEPFRLPLDTPIEITDAYGYSRSTGGSTLNHKGTDYRAAIGTPVYAMNDGVVEYQDFLRNYGNMIAIDHGLTLQTLYLHLSEVYVDVGDTVKKGQLIGRTGDTGYVLGPHLHLSIRVNKTSIDPMTFIKILGE